MPFSKYMPQKHFYRTLFDDYLLHMFTLPAVATDGVKADNGR